ncbi:MAG: hypothetical protein COB83_05080 [Gammaproteobacteria bacterium]|nr:MAG: hypothetical protein COB83_05080 [Gammaproteobacteria bacterium]
MTFDSLFDAWGIALGLRAMMIIWDLLAESGLLFIPLISLFLRKGTSVISEGYDESAIRDITVKSIVIGLVWVLALVPSVKFQVSEIKTYPRLCENIQGNIARSIYSNTNNDNRASQVIRDKYDVIMNGQTIYLPPLLSVTMSIATGFKNAAISQLPCATDVRMIKSSIDSHQLEGNFKTEVTNFIKWCYNPVKNKANREGLLPPIEYQWPGHRTFIETVGYYDNANKNGFYAKEAYDGFGGTSNIMEESATLPQGYGYPTCKEWWLGVNNATEHALRGRLYRNTAQWIQDEEENIFKLINVDYVPTNRTVVIKKDAFIDRRDAIIRDVYFSNKDMIELSSNAAADYGLDVGDTNTFDYLARGLGTIGILWGSISQFAGASMVQLAAPMAKPLILIFILIAYVPALLVGSYQIKHVITFLSVIASIMFWPFLWEVGRILDDTLLDATGGALDGETGVNQAMVSQWLANFFFLYGPVLFSTALGWVGMAGGEIAQAKTKGVSSAGSAGSKGGGVVRKGASNTKKKATKGMG